MTIGGHKAIRHKKSSAGNAGAESGPLPRETDLIDAIDVANGIAIAVQDHGRHGLFLFELVHLTRKLLYLVFKVVSGWRCIVVRHEASRDKQENAQRTMHQPLPGGADWFFVRL